LKGADGRLAHAVRAAIAPWLGTRTLAVCGRAWALLEPFEALAGVRVVRSAGTAEELLTLLGTGTHLGGVCVRERLLDERLVALLRERADAVLAWTVNSPARARELASWGVDGLVTDDRALLERAGAPPLAA
jgi:glycerophosphoryl diester phosphodiesterase